MNFFVTVLACHALSFWNDWGADIGDVFWSSSRTFSQQSSCSKGHHYQWHGEEDLMWLISFSLLLFLIYHPSLLIFSSLKLVWVIFPIIIAIIIKVLLLQLQLQLIQINKIPDICIFVFRLFQTILQEIFMISFFPWV